MAPLDPGRHPWRAVAAILGLATTLACAGGSGTSPAAPEPAPTAVDSLAPTSSGDDAPTLQLHTVTLCTDDIDAIRAFYGDGLGMDVRGPVPLDPGTMDIQRSLWGIPAGIGWQLYLLDRPAVPGTVQIRVLALDQPTPLVHRSWGPGELGPLSLGFPTADLEAWDAELRAEGFTSLMPLSRYRIPRPDGTDYGIHETIFKAPDHVHAVAISRRDGMAQLGPLDPATGRGGPVYSAQIVADSDRVLDFYVDVLGLELRSDRHLRSSGSKGALGLPDGTEFRFSIVYAEGARDGHLLFLDFDRALGELPPAAPPRPPGRGLVMWSFPVRDLAATEERIRANGVEVVAPPVGYSSPSLGPHRALTVLDPTGFMVELFEPTAPRG